VAVRKEGAPLPRTRGARRAHGFKHIDQDAEEARKHIENPLKFNAQRASAALAKRSRRGSPGEAPRVGRRITSALLVLSGAFSGRSLPTTRLTNSQASARWPSLRQSGGDI
jgi:hypothetical protein